MCFCPVLFWPSARYHFNLPVASALHTFSVLAVNIRLKTFTCLFSFSFMCKWLLVCFVCACLMHTNGYILFQVPRPATIMDCRYVPRSLVRPNLVHRIGANLILPNIYLQPHCFRGTTAIECIHFIMMCILAAPSPKPLYIAFQHRLHDLFPLCRKQLYTLTRWLSAFANAIYHDTLSVQVRLVDNSMRWVHWFEAAHFKHSAPSIYFAVCVWRRSSAARIYKMCMQTVAIGPQCNCETLHLWMHWRMRLTLAFQAHSSFFCFCVVAVAYHRVPAFCHSCTT